MSNLSVNTITDASGGSTASINGLTPQASNMQPFNRIINGAMTIDQRNAGASVSAINGGYTVDRWITTAYDAGSQTGKFTVQQNSGNAPVFQGFTQCAKITSSAATTVSNSGIYAINQVIEGLNLSDLAWGTASAKSITVSFWVCSSLTGNFGGAINNSDGNYNYPFQYTINSADIWEYKTITIAGPTSGTWLTTNGVGLYLRFGLGAGSSWSQPAGAWTTTTAYTANSSVSVVGTSGATFYITGVQLEAGSSASSFAHEFVGDTLRKCQRYYEWGGATGSGYGEVTAIFDAGSTSSIDFKVSKRAVPTMTNMSLSGNQYPNNAGDSVPRYENGYGRGFRYTTEHNTTFWNYVSGSGGTQGTSVGHQIIWNASAEL
jgi:hypothetical protein